MSIIINDNAYRYDVDKGKLLKPFVISVRGEYPIKQPHRDKGARIEKPFIQKQLREYLDDKCPVLFNGGVDGAPMVLYDRIMALPGRNNSNWSFHLNVCQTCYSSY